VLHRTATEAAVALPRQVIMPYSSLVHRETRDTLGLRLERSVVIIDEAHNLVDAVAQAHSVPVSGVQLGAAAAALSAYLQR